MSLKSVFNRLRRREVQQPLAMRDMLLAAYETRLLLQKSVAARRPAAEAVADLVHEIRTILDQLYGGRLVVDYAAQSVRVVSGARHYDLISFSNEPVAYPLHVYYHDDCADEQELRALAMSLFRNERTMAKLDELAEAPLLTLAAGTETFDALMDGFLDGEKFRKSQIEAHDVVPAVERAAGELGRLAAEESDELVNVMHFQGRIVFKSSHAMMFLADVGFQKSFPVVIDGRVAGNAAELDAALRRLFVAKLADGTFESFVREAKAPSF